MPTGGRFPEPRRPRVEGYITRKNALVRRHLRRPRPRHRQGTPRVASGRHRANRSTGAGTSALRSRTRAARTGRSRLTLAGHIERTWLPRNARQLRAVTLTSPTVSPTSSPIGGGTGSSAPNPSTLSSTTWSAPRSASASMMSPTKSTSGVSAGPGHPSRRRATRWPPAVRPVQVPPPRSRRLSPLLAPGSGSPAPVRTRRRRPQGGPQVSAR